MIIKTTNNQFEKAPKTYLSSALASGGTTVTVKNINSFSDNWNVQIGDIGHEKTEVIEIEGAPASGAINLAAAITYDHPSDTPVYCIKYNQIIFKQSTTGTAGTATAMANGTMNITPDWKFTQFDDTGGSASYAYKTAYRSTGLTTNSSDSDWITPAGYDFYSLAKIRQRVKDKMVNPDKVDDDKLDDWINEWMESMNNAAVSVNEDFALGTVDLAYSGTAQYATISGTCNFKSVRRAWYTENGTDWAQMTKQEYTDFSPNETFSETHPYYHMKGDDELGRNPHESSGTVRLTHYKNPSVLDSDADSLPYSMRAYTGSFVKWGLAQSYRNDNKPNDAERLEMQAEAERDRFKKEVTPRNKSGPTYIKIVEEMGGDIDRLWIR